MIGVVGDLLTDVVVRLDGEHLQGSIRYGTDTDVSVQHRRGGSAANLAVAAARLGAKVAFIGNVGDDSRGKNLLEELANEGVEAFVTRSGSTGTVVALLDSTGERSMLTDRGSAKELAKWEPDWLESINILHVPGYSLVVEPLASTACEMMRAHKNKHKNKQGNESKITSIGISSVGAVEDYGVDQFWQIIEQAAPDLVICNKDEAELLGERLYGLGPDYAAVVTAGSRPTCIFRNGEIIEVSPPDIGEVPDTTGAGDAFSAGFLVGLSQDKPLAEAVELGNKAASDLLLSRAF